MQISKVKIKNYKILENVEIELSKLSVIIGSNNSGKTTFLEALTLPFSANEIASRSKRMGLTDFSKKCIDSYLKFINDNKTKIIENNDGVFEKFIDFLPYIEVSIEFIYKEDEYFLLTDILSEVDVDSEDFIVSITYNFSVKNPEKAYQNVRSILNNQLLSEENSELSTFVNNLLPMDLFDYSIYITNRNKSIPYELYKNLKYDFISTNRDEFSSTNSSLGARSLVSILNNKLTEDNKLILEKDYGVFFNSVKKLS